MLSREKKSLRQIAHHLDSVILIGDQGVTPGVELETQRALKDHELIKVKISISDRQTRDAAAHALAAACQAEIVQRIGRVFVFYRDNPKANPKLSNVKRFAS
ncbi:MAG: YhbY family RNA-binding protein [bacterium]